MMSGTMSSDGRRSRGTILVLALGRPGHRTSRREARCADCEVVEVRPLSSEGRSRTSRGHRSGWGVDEPAAVVGRWTTVPSNHRAANDPERARPSGVHAVVPDGRPGASIEHAGWRSDRDRATGRVGPRDRPPSAGATGGSAPAPTRPPTTDERWWVDRGCWRASACWRRADRCAGGSPCCGTTRCSTIG